MRVAPPSVTIALPDDIRIQLDQIRTDLLAAESSNNISFATAAATNALVAIAHTLLLIHDDLLDISGKGLEETIGGMNKIPQERDLNPPPVPGE